MKAQEAMIKNKCINVSSKVLVKNHNAQRIVLISSEVRDYYQIICSYVSKIYVATTTITLLSIQFMGISVSVVGITPKWLSYN